MALTNGGVSQQLHTGGESELSRGKSLVKAADRPSRTVRAGTGPRAQAQTVGDEEEGLHGKKEPACPSKISPSVWRMALQPSNFLKATPDTLCEMFSQPDDI